MIQMMIIGNLVRDPETHTFSDGSRVCNFDVAVNRRVNGEEVAQFMRVHAYGTRGEHCQKYLQRGSKVYVEGRPEARAYSSREGTPKAALEIYANSIEFLSSGRGNTGAEEAEPAETAQDATTFTEVDDDELPF